MKKSKGIMIDFDSNSWRSIRRTANQIKEAGTLQVGTTEKGEFILFDVGNDGDGDILITEVYQKNGWVRKNIYHLSDHTTEEIYHREEGRRQNV